MITKTNHWLMLILAKGLAKAQEFRRVRFGRCDTVQPPTTEVNLTITGGLHSSESVRELIEAINQEMGK